MPIGPNGEKRPADVVTNAVHVMRIATGEDEETYVDTAKRKAGLKGRRGSRQCSDHREANRNRATRRREALEFRSLTDGFVGATPPYTPCAGN